MTKGLKADTIILIYLQGFSPCSIIIAVSSHQKKKNCFNLNHSIPLEMKAQNFILQIIFPKNHVKSLKTVKSL